MIILCNKMKNANLVRHVLYASLLGERDQENHAKCNCQKAAQNPHEANLAVERKKAVMANNLKPPSTAVSSLQFSIIHCTN